MLFNWKQRITNLSEKSLWLDRLTDGSAYVPQVISLKNQLLYLN